MATFSLLVRAGLVVLKDSTTVSVIRDQVTRKVTGGGQAAPQPRPSRPTPNFQSVVKKFTPQATEAANPGLDLQLMISNKIFLAN